MKTNHTDITIVLDRSGSMQSVASDTIGGFNRFMADQRNTPGTAVITLHQFDDVFETPIKTQDVKTAPDLTDKTFVPRGNTALLDAMGRAIMETGMRLRATPEDDRAEKVVVVIITDGQENASKEFTQGRVNEMILHQRMKYQWEFVFLGANQDAIQVATSYGVHAANAMTYAANRRGTAAAFASTSRNLAEYRRSESISMAYKDEDHAKQNEAGNTENKPATK